MPKVHFVKKARKDHREDIKKGDSYYWWKFRFGPKVMSKTRPKASQLTRSDFLAEYYEIHEYVNGLSGLVEDEVANLVDQLQTMLETCQDNLENMPEHLQDTSESGIMLQERIDGLEGWIADLENIDWDETSPEDAIDAFFESDPGF